ncbi:MAG TPA: DNA polymerase III subunit, partial [Gemmatimonadales bacterium]|nr:DNA polymerase III subunit [Gemmatimonadales bacterium]
SNYPGLDGLLTFCSMLVHSLVGHHETRRRLAQAVQSKRLPQVLVLAGPWGVGKQRLALWLAQLVLCEAAGEEPCGSCRACRLVGGLAHPDLHWFVPIARPKASETDKQVEEASQAIAEVMEERRARPLYAQSDGMASHGIASVRLLQRRGILTSVEGGRRVFIIGEADRLVSQESSPEAANALLKLLEEPPPGSLFVLTTVDAQRLLPTIRSRAVLLRVGGVADADVRGFLAAHLRPAPSAAELDQRVAAAGGSIGRALAVGEESSKAQQAAERLLEAVMAGPGPSFEQALKQAPWSARGDFTAMLDALAETLSEATRETLGQTPRRPVPRALRRYGHPDRLLKAMEHVEDAREAAWGNVNPQILLAILGEELAEIL